MKNSYIIFVLFLSLLFVNESIGQTSPDYIFGSDNGSGWNWTTGTNGTASLGSSYIWQFAATVTTNHYVKFGESSSNSDGSGFWVNSSGGDMNYTGAGAKWTAYYQANMGGGGAIYWAITTANYYVIKTKKQGGNDADFAVFDNGAQAPRTITAVTRSISGTTLNVDATLSGTKGTTEKIWVRYSTNNWASSSTVEANSDQGGNVWRAALSLVDGNFVSYYTYTTIQQAVAPAEADADFFTVNYNNNSGVNYTAQIGNFSGDYYIPQSGNAKGFDKLSTAVTNLNSNGMSANVNFYITGDFTETVNIGLINNSDYTLTIRPDADADRTITFNKATDNAGPSGALCLGIGMGLAWTDLSPTKNVVIDGYADGGSTRRLKIATALTHNGINGPILLIDDCSNIQIKNCIVQHVGASTGSSNYGIYLRVNTAYGTKKMPSNITIENNTITATQNTASQAIGIFANAAPTSLATGIIIQNNIITARTRGIFLYYTNNINILSNEFRINQSAGSVLSSAIMGNSGQTGDVNVFGNKFLELKSANSTTASSPNIYGMRAIIASGGGNWYIQNNFFSGFDKTTAAAGGSTLQGIRAGSTCFIRNNTFYLNSLTNKPTYIAAPTDANDSYCAINIAAGTPEIKNNIFISDEDAVHNFLIRGTNGGASDYNLMYLKAGNTNARFNGTYTTFNDYKIGTSKDANSKSKDVNFINASTGDLHLTGASLGDLDLIGTPIAGITTDIDGETRHVTYPYMGADENLANPLPVELTSFNANAFGKDVKISWSTATEVNSYQFVVERSDNEEWNVVGTVNASGNSNSPKQYSFTDNNLQQGKYQYRLKMIDNDGSYEYSQTVEVNIDVPKEFALMQNYPNPFNPVTNINYTIPVDSKVMLVIYSISGEKVAELINETQSAGSYSIPFNAANLASGTYVYRLIANDFVQTKKMLLIK